MKDWLLDYLACPVTSCRQELHMREVFSHFPGQSAEIREGCLICRTCGSLYPIFLGIPILVPDVPTYMLDNLPLLQALSEKHGGLDKRLLADSLLLAKNACGGDREITFKLTLQEAEKILNEARNSPSLVHHYDDASELVPADHPLYDFVKEHSARQPQHLLERYFVSHGEGRGPGLEVGCSYGGFLNRLAAHSEPVCGVDVSFVTLFYAQCILKHLPLRISDYEARLERNIVTNRALATSSECTDVALIVGRGEALPFRSDTFALVASLNVLDVVDDLHGLLHETLRVLKHSGLLVSSSPFDFSDARLQQAGIKSDQAVLDHIQELLGNRIEALETHDNVPWILYYFQRCLSVYNTLCFCGKRVDIRRSR